LGILNCGLPNGTKSKWVAELTRDDIPPWKQQNKIVEKAKQSSLDKDKAALIKPKGDFSCVMNDQ